VLCPPTLGADVAVLDPSPLATCPVAVLVEVEVEMEVEVVVGDGVVVVVVVVVVVLMEVRRMSLTCLMSGKEPWPQTLCLKSSLAKTQNMAPPSPVSTM